MKKIHYLLIPVLLAGCQATGPVQNGGGNNPVIDNTTEISQQDNIYLPIKLKHGNVAESDINMNDDSALDKLLRDSNMSRHSHMAQEANILGDTQKSTTSKTVSESKMDMKKAPVLPIKSESLVSQKKAEKTPVMDVKKALPPTVKIADSDSKKEPVKEVKETTAVKKDTSAKETVSSQPKAKDTATVVKKEETKTTAKSASKTVEKAVVKTDKDAKTSVSDAKKPVAVSEKAKPETAKPVKADKTAIKGY